MSAFIRVQRNLPKRGVGFKFCLVSGTVALLNVKVGDVVKTGQTVATVRNDSAMTLKVPFASDNVDGFASSLWRKSEFSERGTQTACGPFFWPRFAEDAPRRRGAGGSPQTSVANLPCGGYTVTIKRKKRGFYEDSGVF